ncbi:MAG: thioredoxin domain-containing protein [Rhodobacteraceae bacterium]|nr:thioredoxin domain-containing protein [Paracoccaceae bacterium]
MIETTRPLRGLLSTFRASVAALAMLALPAQAVDLGSMSAEEREAFRAEVRSYLLDNPEVILEAIEILEQRQAVAEAQADVELVASNREALFDDGYSWVGGNPDGDITLVEFMDYRCGYCRRAVPEVEELLAADGNIRLIIKEFPILGDASVLSSRFAVATKHVAGDEAYKQVHDALIAFSGEPSEVSLRRLAEGLGLDADPIMAAMDSDQVTEELRQTRELAQRLRISGTPTFVLENELLRGYLPADQLAIIAAEQREQG